MPYWRLSAFYFFYFGSLGILVPFWGLYLQDRGYSALEIGQLMAVILGTKVVAPNVWGWIADHTGWRMSIVRLASLLSMLIFVGVFWVEGFWPLAVVMTLFTFFWNASIPLVEAATFNHLKGRIHRYASVRLWGSIGFIVAVGLLGRALEWWSTAIVPWVLLGLYAGIWLSSLSVPEAEDGSKDTHAGSIASLLRRREVLAFFFACFMMQASHGAYYAFYSIYLEGYGYSKTAIGGLWALGVLIEVLMFMVMHHLLKHFGARNVLIASLGLAVVRWLMIGGFPEQLWVMILAQTLHAATFGTFHAAAIHLVHHYFTGRFQGRGQALYSSLSFGAGGAVGSLASAYLWSGAGAGVTFAVASGAALLGTLAVWQWVDIHKRF